MAGAARRRWWTPYYCVGIEGGSQSAVGGIPWSAWIRQPMSIEEEAELPLPVSAWVTGVATNKEAATNTVPAVIVRTIMTSILAPKRGNRTLRTAPQLQGHGADSTGRARPINFGP